METGVLHSIRQRAGSIIEPQLLKAGQVLAVRAWEPQTIMEIDLHLPMADMQLWKEVPYIKLRVDALTYRDYTPSGWDAETHTCTLYIDTAHKGAGSAWARNLQPGDRVHYLKLGTTHHVTTTDNLVIGLGDESGIGHLLALQQSCGERVRFAGAALVSEEQHRAFFDRYFSPALQPVAHNEDHGYKELMDWVEEQDYCMQQTTFCLVGNNQMVGQLRRLLKQKGCIAQQIMVKGFWS